MPLGHIIEAPPLKKEELIARLVQEWLHPNPEAEEPIVIVQPNPRDEKRVYLYVIWHEWVAFSYSDRSEIIHEAYAATHTKTEALRVTAAYGYTANEAMNRRIFYTTDTTQTAPQGSNGKKQNV